MHFSLVPFKISFFLNFKSLIITWFATVLFVFILFEAHSIYVCVFPKFRNFSAICLNTFSAPPFFCSPSGTPMTQMFYHLLYSHMSLMMCSFFFFLTICLCCSEWVILMFHVQVQWFFPLSFPFCWVHFFISFFISSSFKILMWFLASSISLLKLFFHLSVS